MIVQQILLTVLHRVLDVDHAALPAAAHRQRYHLLELRPALDALLHDRGAVLARHHVAARFEKHRRLPVRAHQTLVDLFARQHRLPADQTLLDARATVFAAHHVPARFEHRVALLVRAQQTLVQRSTAVPGGGGCDAAGYEGG